MQFGLFAPVDGEREECREAGDVEERDAEKEGCVGLMELMELEARHDNGSGEAKRDHEGAESGTEPAEGSMYADVVRAHERRLKDEEEYPGREGCGMDPEDARAR